MRAALGTAQPDQGPALGLVVFQVRWILRSRFPDLRAVEALATSIPLFLLLFASTYVVLAAISASDFSEPLTRTDALYFTVTVFSTVGFGDITAKTEAARLVVTGYVDRARDDPSCFCLLALAAD